MRVEGRLPLTFQGEINQDSRSVCLLDGLSVDSLIFYWRVDKEERFWTVERLLTLLAYRATGMYQQRQHNLREILCKSEMTTTSIQLAHNLSYITMLHYVAATT